MNSISLPLIALTGTPNCGKTSLFNIFTGSHQRVGNYPGITVEKKIGVADLNGVDICELIDLPGTYSLDTRTLDERVAKNVLLGKDASTRALNGIIAVVDSTNLERSLYLVFELKKLNIPMIVALNLYDVATSRGQVLNLVRLEEMLGVPVVPTSAKTEVGLTTLLEKIQTLPKEFTPNKDLSPQEFRKIESIQGTFAKIDQMLKVCVEQKIKPDSLTARVDRIVLHPVFGPLSLAIILLCMFQAIFTWAAPMSDLIEAGIGKIGEFATSIIPAGDFQSFVVDGIITGAGNVFVFLPQIILLFVFVLFLEDIGYLGRAALMMDSIMRRLGLPGKAVVPLLSSHACAVPGIMAARTIDNEKDRLVTMLVAPLTTCSARIPVYTLLIAAIVPSNTVLGFFSLQGLAMFALYALGVVSSLVMAWILKKTVVTGSASHLLLEIPGYRMPSFRNIILSIIQRVKVFTKKAGSIILVLSMIIWALVTYPKSNDPDAGINHSFAAMIGRTFTPIFAPIGFDWRLTTALIPSLGAREVVVSTLSTVLSIDGDQESAEFQHSFTEKVIANFGIPSLLSLMMWFAFSPQCISTIAIFKRESGSVKWTTVMVAYTLGLAYLASFITYRIALYFY